MGFFKKEKGYVDLGEKLRKKEERVSNFKESIQEEKTSEESSGGFFGFFGGNAQASEVQSDSQEDKRKKISEKLRELTSKIEEQENEIYRLKQRVEVLERKQRVGY